MLAFYRVARTVIREAGEDRITGEAARVAYYFFLSLFPAILALFAFTGIFGGDAAFEWIMARLRAALPGEAAAYLSHFVREVTGESRPGMASLGLLLAAWSASNAFAALADGLNRMYDLEEGRPWWKRRFLSLAVLVVSLVLLNGGTAVVIAGPELIDAFDLRAVRDALLWPVGFGLLAAMMWLIYLLLPNRRPGRSLSPQLAGALVGAAMWVGGTAAFRFYLANFGGYSKTYGVVGGVIVLLLWLYLTALAILFGGEVAATLKQLAREDWDVGRPPPPDGPDGPSPPGPEGEGRRTGAAEPRAAESRAAESRAAEPRAAESRAVGPGPTRRGP